MKVTLGQLSESAEIILGHVQLQIIALQRAAFEVHISDATPPFDTKVTARITGNQKGSGQLITAAKYSIACFTDDENHTDVWTATIQVAAEWLVTGLDPDEIDLVAIKGFSITTAAPALHPYVREILQDLTARSEYPAYTMGLMESIANLPDSHEFEIEDGAADS